MDPMGTLNVALGTSGTTWGPLWTLWGPYGPYGDPMEHPEPLWTL